MPRLQPSWLPLHSKRSIRQDLIRETKPLRGRKPAGRFLRAKSGAAGEGKDTFYAKNCPKEKIWNKYKKICKNC